MTEKAILHHAGCSVRVYVEQRFARALDQSLFEIVPPGEQKARLAKAEAAGVKSVPAFVIGDAVHRIDSALTSRRSVEIPYGRGGRLC